MTPLNWDFCRLMGLMAATFVWCMALMLAWDIRHDWPAWGCFIGMIWHLCVQAFRRNMRWDFATERRTD